MQAVCSGFVYAVTTADKFLTVGLARRALVIGSETFSRILDWSDRSTCVLFGDGAGAVVLEAQREAGHHRRPRRARRPACARTARHRDKLFVDGGPSSTRTVGHLRMEGREVFKHAVGMITDVIEDAFAAGRHHGRGPRLVRAAPGQQPHHRRLAPRSSASPSEKVVVTVAAARQYLGGLRAAGARSRRSRTGASRGSIWCCWRRWAAASPGARSWSAGKPNPTLR